jgi:hypothetical protein
MALQEASNHEEAKSIRAYLDNIYSNNQDYMLKPEVYDTSTFLKEVVTTKGKILKEVPGAKKQIAVGAGLLGASVAGAALIGHQMQKTMDIPLQNRVLEVGTKFVDVSHKNPYYFLRAMGKPLVAGLGLSAALNARNPKNTRAVGGVASGMAIADSLRDSIQTNKEVSNLPSATPYGALAVPGIIAGASEMMRGKRWIADARHTHNLALNKDVPFEAVLQRASHYENEDSLTRELPVLELGVIPGQQHTLEMNSSLVDILRHAKAKHEGKNLEEVPSDAMSKLIDKRRATLLKNRYNEKWIKDGKKITDSDLVRMNSQVNRELATTISNYRRYIAKNIRGNAYSESIESKHPEVIPSRDPKTDKDEFVNIFIPKRFKEKYLNKLPSFEERVVRDYHEGLGHDYDRATELAKKDIANIDPSHGKVRKSVLHSNIV